MYVCIYIDYLSTPPSSYLCVSTCAHKGRGSVCTRSYIGLRIHTCCRVCASALRRRETPLHAAAINGHADVVAALLKHGADVHAKIKWG